MKRPLFVVSLVLTVILAPSLAAQDFQRGLNAYNRGDYQAALKIWRPLAGAGNAEALYRLGEMYGAGLGVQKDSLEAAELFGRAANQGHARAQFSLGLMYEIGDGVSQNHNIAIYWFDKAAESFRREKDRKNKSTFLTSQLITFLIAVLLLLTLFGTIYAYIRFNKLRASVRSPEIERAADFARSYTPRYPPPNYDAGYTTTPYYNPEHTPTSNIKQSSKYTRFPIRIERVPKSGALMVVSFILGTLVTLDMMSRFDDFSKLFLALSFPFILVLHETLRFVFFREKSEKIIITEKQVSMRRRGRFEGKSRGRKWKAPTSEYCSVRWKGSLYGAEASGLAQHITELVHPQNEKTIVLYCGHSARKAEQVMGNVGGLLSLPTEHISWAEALLDEFEWYVTADSRDGGADDDDGGGGGGEGDAE